MAENNPVASSSEGNGATSATPDTPEMVAVKAAREAFFARARVSGTAAEVATSHDPHVTPALQSARQASPNGSPGALASPQERIASRNSGDGLLAVGVLSDLGGERAYRVWASGDSEDLKAIADPQTREKAFETIVDNMRMPQYHEALSLVDYGLEREALRVLIARGEVDVERPAPEINGVVEAPATAAPDGVPSVDSTGSIAPIQTTRAVADTVPSVMPLETATQSPTLDASGPQAEPVAVAASSDPVSAVDVPADLQATNATDATPEAIPRGAPAAATSEAVEENAIEAVPAPKLEQSPNEVSDAEKRREAEDKASRRNAGARLLDAFTRSLIGRDRPDSGNEISSPAIMTKDGYAIPEAIASRYVVRDGDFWRFDEKDPGNSDNHKPKFTDKGPRLATGGEDRGTAADMVTVAIAKGWQQVTLKGTEAFRRNAWMEATLAGMKTRGFEPQEQDRAMLEEARRERDALIITAGKRSPPVPQPLSPSTFALTPTPAPKQATENAPGKPPNAAPVVAPTEAAISSAQQSAYAAPAAASPATPTVQASQAVAAAAIVPEAPVGLTDTESRTAPKQVGQSVLLEHGAAPYKNDKDNADSYYVSYSDPDGATKTVWGKDLERAVRDSGVQPGDALTLENLGSRPVTVNRPVKDVDGKVIRIDQIDTRLNVWEIQKQNQSRGSQDPAAVAMNVAGLREQVEKALAGQPDNVVREVMDRLAERLQAGVAVQAEHQKAGSAAQDLKPAIDASLAQVDVDREARQMITEVPKPKRNPERDVAKQSAPSVAR
ncbi:LPD7 domain-containing protein [Caballeronia sordidicola]|uniref:IncQ plasmid conjugative transfer DNA primase TraO n=1 Tax=Caballeronia sordidicola TaxID=196367 RepID=A0A242MW00_CABSO|nr:LPD7 domain-containing protein [Caballeronia sordidicola]OTP75618.1 IncQ plasmid conjugative transfer DNA primase TraO [Caballeronia sordidicola]